MRGVSRAFGPAFDAYEVMRVTREPSVGKAERYESSRVSVGVESGESGVRNKESGVRNK